MNSADETVKEIKNLFYRRDKRKCVDTLRELSNKGEYAPAAEMYGDLLMMGVWDTQKMEFDLIKNELIPEDTGTPDPYLILARNPVEAIKYYKKASETPSSQKAYDKVAYCEAKGLAGFKGDKSLVVPKLPAETVRFLDKNARNSCKAIDLESDTFIPLPDLRPKVEDPFTKMFKRMAIKFRNRTALQIIFTQLVAGLSFFYSTWTNAILLYICIMAAFNFPLLYFLIISHFKGYKRGLPLCTCTKIQNAYTLSIRDIPEDIRKQRYPFETTKAYIRHALTIKTMFLWFYSIISTIRVTQLIINFKGYLDWLDGLEELDTRGVLFFTIPVNSLILSTVMIFQEKRFDTTLFDSSATNSVLSMTYMIITFLGSFWAHDRDCQNETEIRIHKSQFEQLLDNL